MQGNDGTAARTRRVLEQVQRSPREESLYIEEDSHCLRTADSMAPDLSARGGINNSARRYVENESAKRSAHNTRT